MPVVRGARLGTATGSARGFEARESARTATRNAPSSSGVGGSVCTSEGRPVSWRGALALQTGTRVDHRASINRAGWVAGAKGCFSEMEVETVRGGGP